MSSPTQLLPSTPTPTQELSWGSTLFYLEGYSHDVIHLDLGSPTFHMWTSSASLRNDATVMLLVQACLQRAGTLSAQACLPLGGRKNSQAAPSRL